MSSRGEFSQKILLFLVLLCQSFLLATALESTAEGEWSHERMAAARPMPMPQALYRFQHSIPTRRTIGSIRETEKRRETFQIMNEIQQPFVPKLLSSRVFPETAERAYPFSAVAKIFFLVPGKGDFTCSGSMIKRGLVLTAGHCVHTGNWTSPGRGFHSNIVVVPAFSNGYAPFGQHQVQNVLVQADWAEKGWAGPVNSGDFALLVLAPVGISSNTFAGHYTGYLGWQINSIEETQVLAAGFPSNLNNGARMHFVVSATNKRDAIGTVAMVSDMGPGSSGSPWIINFGRSATGQSAEAWNRVVGVSSYGPVDSPEKYSGSSILSIRFVRMLDAACRAYPAHCGA